MCEENHTSRPPFKRRHLVFVTAVIVTMALSLQGCNLFTEDDEEPVVRETFLLGTLVRITVHEWEQGTDVEGALDETLVEMEKLGARVSVYEDESDVNRVNESPQTPIEVSEDTLHLLQTALQMNRETEGAFDPTIGPLVSLWGFYTGDYRVPDSEEIQHALQYVDASSVQVDPEARTVRIKEGMQLDLEALAKGLAAQRAEAALTERGVTSALISAGHSSVHAVGDGPGGRPWKIGLIHPRNLSEIYGKLQIRASEAVSTSGDYQRYFEENDTRYSHIIDPQTGRPGRTIKTITVLTDDSIIADALSTALFLFEPQEALQWADERGGVDVVIMTADGAVLYSEAIEDRLQLEDD